MSRRKPIVWVVMHYEIMGLPESFYVDSVQSHVSSSLEKAEEYLRVMHVDAHSWWQVHPHTIDSTDFPERYEVYFYSHRGTRLRAAPWRRAVAAYRKRAAE